MIPDTYFRHLCKTAFGDKFMDYSKLCLELHNKPFEYSIDMDENRLIDGLEMRNEYMYTHPKEKNDLCGWYKYDTRPCSVFEVLIALADRCWSSILDDGENDQAGELFKLMLSNMGLLDYKDDVFDKTDVNVSIELFLDRKYDSDGRGGPFYIPGIDKDMRKVELWYQAMWYIDSILN